MKINVRTTGLKSGATQYPIAPYRMVTRLSIRWVAANQLKRENTLNWYRIGGLLVLLIVQLAITSRAGATHGKHFLNLTDSSPADRAIFSPKPAKAKRNPARHSVRRKTRHAAIRKAKPTARKVRAVPQAKKAPVMLTVPLFGSQYARVTVSDQQVGGSIYYLASGHGGPDPGAVGTYGKFALAEDEYAYDVTIRLARVLMSHGATVYMIVQDPNDGIRDAAVLPIDHDEVAYPHQTIPLDQNARLKQGTMAVNTLYARHKKAYQRSVVIHVDSRSTGQMIDVFFYHHDRSPAGKKLAKHIHRSFTAGYKRSQPGRSYLGTVSTRNTLYVVKNTVPPTVFIELGNIQNDKDQRRFVISDNRQALANWLYEGIRADYQSR